MIEQIGNYELGNVSEIDKNYSIVAQIIVDSYLQYKDGITMKSFLEEKGLENKPGLIYDYHLVMLQNMFDEEFNVLGTSLKAEIERTGGEFVPAKLSDFEVKLLANRVVFSSNLMNVIKNNIEK